MTFQKGNSFKYKSKPYLMNYDSMLIRKSTLLILYTSNILKIRLTIKCIVFQATCKHDHRLAALKTRRCYLQKKKEEESKQFDENTNWLHRVETEMRLLGQNGHIPKVQMCLCKHTSEILCVRFQTTAIKLVTQIFPNAYKSYVDTIL